ncbi:uncharacterized protein LOC134710320 [Mytilus trossulus]|uniref:uncharacterized protein LOC134710320 n=1 Tax=Mytilus trossulus TaxID=6551 RepID=UPI00300548AE
MFLLVFLTVIFTISLCHGCSQRNTVSIEDNLKTSHLVVGATIIGENVTFYKANVLCVIKNSKRLNERYVLIPKEGTHSDGLCFENNFEYYTKYILFLRELVPSAPLYRTYSAELPYSRLTEMKDICENSNICEEGKDSCFSGTGTTIRLVWTIMCVPMVLMYLGYFT